LSEGAFIGSVTGEERSPHVTMAAAETTRVKTSAITSAWLTIFFPFSLPKEFASLYFLNVLWHGVFLTPYYNMLI
jgi:hypothetical protein